MSFSERETPGGHRPKLSEMTGHIHGIRRAASDVVELLTGNAAMEYEIDHKPMRSALKMEQRFDVTEETTILAEAMATWRATRYVDNSYVPPKEMGIQAEVREYSVSDELRMLDTHAKALAQAVRTCREEVKDCRENAEGADVGRLRKCSEALKEAAGHTRDIASSMDAMQGIVSFRRAIAPSGASAGQATEHASGRPVKPTSGRTQGA